MNVLTKVKNFGSVHKPEIFVTAGIIGVVAATVLACKSTLKVEKVVSEHEENLKAIKEAKEGYDQLNDNGDITEVAPISDKEYGKAVVGLYLSTTGKLVKLYAPAVSVGVVSIAAILYGHNVLRKRYLGLTAAYGILEESFSQYRKRVIEKYGEEEDDYFKTGIKKDIAEVVTVDEKGKEKVKKEEVEVIEPGAMSPYSRIFDSSNPNYKKNVAANRFFINGVRNYFQTRLESTGHVFLNEVYERLGYPHTSAGAVMGWVKGYGDQTIDFMTRDVLTEADRRFVNELEPTVWLDFNVTTIWDKI